MHNVPTKLKRGAIVLGLLAPLAMPVLARAQAELPSHATVAAVEHVPAEEKKDLVQEEFQPAESAWIIIIFVILLAVLYPTAWKNVLAGLKAREERIRKDIADAEAARVHAETSLKDYNARLAGAEASIREMLAKANADGERIGTAMRMQAQQEVEAIKERATKEIESAKTQAIGEIYAQAADLATSVAEKILRRSLSADDQRELVKQSLEQMQGKTF